MKCPFCGSECHATFKTMDGMGLRVACPKCKDDKDDPAFTEAPNIHIGQHEEKPAGESFWSEARRYRGGYDS